MPSPAVDHEQVSLVLLGSFNPGIFHPEWLRRVELATETETQDGPKVMTREVAQVAIGDLELEVQLERLQIFGPASFSARTYALGSGILERLEHMPITSLGMNRHMHFRMDEASVQKVGHKLVPKELWKDLVDDPRTRSVTVQGPRPGGRAKNLFATVERSLKLRQPEAGVFVSVNEHHDVDPATAAEALDHLSEWNDAQGWARKLAEEVLKRCLET